MKQLFLQKKSGSIIPKCPLLSNLVAQTIHNVLKRIVDSKTSYRRCFGCWRLCRWLTAWGVISFKGMSGFFSAFLRSGFPFPISELILKRGRRNQKRALDSSRGAGKVKLNDLETLWCGSTQLTKRKCSNWWYWQSAGCMVFHQSELWINDEFSHVICIAICQTTVQMPSLVLWAIRSFPGLKKSPLVGENLQCSGDIKLSGTKLTILPFCYII